MNQEKQNHLKFKLFMYKYWRIYHAGDYKYENSILDERNRKLKIDLYTQHIQCIPIEPCNISSPNVCLQGMRNNVLRFYTKKRSILLAKCDYNNPSSLKSRYFTIYDDFYNGFVYHYRSIRQLKPLLQDAYKHHPFHIPLYESIFHPDLIRELTALGLSLSAIATKLDEKLLSII